MRKAEHILSLSHVVTRSCRSSQSLTGTLSVNTEDLSAKPDVKTPITWGDLKGPRSFPIVGTAYKLMAKPDQLHMVIVSILYTKF